jgi:hypothetical protein
MVPGLVKAVAIVLLALPLSTRAGLVTSSTDK